MKFIRDMFLLAAMAASAHLCADEVRIVDGRLTRVSSKGREEQGAQPNPAPRAKLASIEWEMQPDPYAVSPATSDEPETRKIEVIPGETLSEKLARINRIKFQELERASLPPTAPDSDETPGAKVRPSPVQQPAPGTPPPIPEAAVDSDIEEMESEYASLLKKIKGRKERGDSIKKDSKPVAESPLESEGPLPPPVELHPEKAQTVEIAGTIPVPTPEAREALDEQIVERLKADMAEAEKAPPPVEEEKLPNYYMNASRFFTVMASNYEARELGVFVVKTIEDTFANYFGADFEIPEKIIMQMLLEDEAKFAGHFQVLREKTIILSVKCNADLPLDELCNIASDAYLAAVSLRANRGYKPVPYWISLGLRAALAQNLATGISYELARFAERRTPEKIGDVLKYSKDTPLPVEFMESSAYWNLSALRALSGGQKNFEALMLSLVSGADPEKLFEPMKTSMGETFDLKMRAIMLGEIYARTGGVKNFEDSEKELVYLLSISKQRQGDSVEAVLDYQIFARRDELTKEIELRISEIKLALPWANPVYYNAYVDLGRMFSAARSGNAEEFDAARADFVAELKKSKTAAQRAQALLAE